MSWVWFAILLVAYFAMDVAWVRWHATVDAGQAHRAGFWAVILLAISLGGGAAVYQHHWGYAIAMLLGSYAGTWWSVRRKRTAELRAAGRPPEPSLLARLLDHFRAHRDRVEREENVIVGGDHMFGRCRHCNQPRSLHGNSRVCRNCQGEALRGLARREQGH